MNKNVMTQDRINGYLINTSSKRAGLSIIAFIAYSTYYISGYSSSSHNYVLIVLFIFWNLIALVEDSKAYQKAVFSKTVALSWLFISYYFVTSLFNGEIINTLENFAMYFMLFGCLIQGKYYLVLNRVQEIKILVIATMAAWLFFSVKAIIFFETNPSAARILAGNFYAFDNIAIGGGYAIAFGSALLCVYLFEIILNRKVKKKSYRIMISVIVVILLWLLIKTESTLTLLSCLSGILISSIRKLWQGNGKYNGFNAKKFFISMVIIIIAVLVFINIQNIGEYIVETTSGSLDNVIVRRLNRIGEKLMYTGTGITYENYIDERRSYVGMSWSTFIRNPLFGIGYKYGNIFSQLKANGVGMHSELVDMLAQHGIIGFIPLLLFFVRAFKFDCKCRDNTYIFTFLLMILYNPFRYFHAYYVLFMLIPLLDYLCFINSEKTQTNYKGQSV